MSETIKEQVPNQINKNQGLNNIPTQQAPPTAEPLQSIPRKQAPRLAAPTRPAGPTASQKEISLQDYLKAAEKISRRQAQLATQPVLESFEKGKEGFLRDLYSRNMGATSGVGQQLGARALESFGKRLEPIAEKTGLAGMRDELGFRQQEDQNRLAEERGIRKENRLEDLGIRKESRLEDLGIREGNRLEDSSIRKETRMEDQGIRAEDRLQKQQYLDDQMKLVESGQLTGDQARELLEQRGINPEEYQTPEQVRMQQENESFKMKLEQTIKDPELRTVIDNQAELDYYMEMGKTYEDEVADILDKAQSFEQWNAKRPQLQQALNAIKDSLRHEESKWFTFVDRDEKKIARLKQQAAALEETLNSLDAGVAPGQVAEANMKDVKLKPLTKDNRGE